MNTIPPDDHLRQALRHAPDADVSAPSDISAQILAAAHRSAAQRPLAMVPAPSAGRRWWAALWHRPGATAALASVVMAGFVGLLWRGETPGPAIEEAPVRATPGAANKFSREAAGAAPPAVAPVAEKPSELLAAAPEPVVADVALPGKTAAPQLRTKAAETAAAAAAAAAAKATEATEATEATRRAIGNAGPTPAPALQTQPAEIAPVQPDRPSATESIAKTEDRARPPQAPSVAGAVAPAPSPAVAEPAAPPTGVSPAPAGRSLRASTSGAAAPEATPALSSAVADPGTSAPWLATAASGDRWRWQPTGALRDPDALWWDSLTLATRGRWQVAVDAQPAAGSVRLDGQRGPERVGRLWLEPASVLWCGAAPPCQRAPLSAASHRELLDRLAR